MLLIDFKAKPRRAFAQGFLKGLGAPFVLYGAFGGYPPVVVEQVQPEHHDDQAALRNDMHRIAEDMKIAVTRYGKKAAG